MGSWGRSEGSRWGRSLSGGGGRGGGVDGCVR